MHDYSKYDDPKDALGILNEEEIKECQEYPFLYHAYLSAEAYKRLMDFDIDIYNAIKYHVFGRPNMSMLEAIIMIADYTEKNRVYPSCIEVRKILVDDNNLNLAIYESLVRTIDFELKEGHKAHPMQIKVKEEYKRKVLEDELRRSNN
jgi:HD superfamily phosphohydrolase YqeK